MVWRYKRKLRTIGGSTVVTLPAEVVRQYPKATHAVIEYNYLFDDMVVSLR